MKYSKRLSPPHPLLCELIPAIFIFLPQLFFFFFYQPQHHNWISYFCLEKSVEGVLLFSQHCDLLIFICLLFLMLKKLPRIYCSGFQNSRVKWTKIWCAFFHRESDFLFFWLLWSTCRRIVRLRGKKETKENIQIQLWTRETLHQPDYEHCLHSLSLISYSALLWLQGLFNLTNLHTPETVYFFLSSESCATQNNKGIFCN